ncbi:coproporphyrinogen III oxidase, partial [Francisella tularensis subsp. holarctica]|nr:coproporphyrinogen III oxidase [Francisella tularensis subsp. holarctica]
PLATWKYNWQPELGSEEDKVYHYISTRDWIK